MDKEKFKSLNKRISIPFADKITDITKSFSITEKTVFGVFVLIFAVTGLLLFYKVNKSFMVAVPDYGGTLIEGEFGSPRFVNPILAVSDIDKDLTALIYSGLLKTDPKGDLVPDLAESFAVSNDGLVYTVKLRDDVFFHDDTRVTVDDVIFTIEKVQDSNLKSPREANWAGVRVDKVDDYTLTFTLKQPYAPFIQSLTIGILPKHIWKTASSEEFPFSQFNIKPIGSGPYKVSSITYTGSGLPSEYYLTSFKKYSAGKPFITNFVVKAFQTEQEMLEAYQDGKVESMHGISPAELSKLKIPSNNILLSPLPRVFGVFLNQNIAPILVNKEVRSALNLSVDRQEIVNQILGGFGQAITGPVPPFSLAEINTSTSTQENRTAQAKAILTKAGWTLNAQGIFEKKDKNKKTSTLLSFSIYTSDAQELKDTAYLLQKQWKELGAQVSVKIFEVGDLNQNIIRTRKYDSLLFGEIIGKDLDLYPFWHSSQRTSPGLNIALYANVKADKALENLRKTLDADDRLTYLSNFNKEINNDIPAIFTYSPYFIYVVPDKVKNASLGVVTSSGDRFSNVNEWFIETNDVWKIFTKN